MLFLYLRRCSGFSHFRADKRGRFLLLIRPFLRGWADKLCLFLFFIRLFTCTSGLLHTSGRISADVFFSLSALFFADGRISAAVFYFLSAFYLHIRTHSNTFGHIRTHSNTFELPLPTSPKKTAIEHVSFVLSLNSFIHKPKGLQTGGPHNC